MQLYFIIKWKKNGHILWVLRANKGDLQSRRISNANRCGETYPTGTRMHRIISNNAKDNSVGTPIVPIILALVRILCDTQRREIGELFE